LPLPGRIASKATNAAGRQSALWGRIVGSMMLVLVAHTVEETGQDEIIRIISARRATRKERIDYDKNRQKNSY